MALLVAVDPSLCCSRVPGTIASFVADMRAESAYISHDAGDREQLHTRKLDHP